MLTRFVLRSRGMSIIAGFLIAAGGFSLVARPLPAQQVETVEETDVDSAAPYRQLPFVEHVVVHDGSAYVCWPDNLVEKATLMALDLETLKMSWTFSLEGMSIIAFCPFGEFLFCRTSNKEATYEFLLRMKSGELVARHQISELNPTHWFDRPYIGERHLIAGRIYEISAGESVCELDFDWTHAFLDGDQLYTLERRKAGPREDVRGFRDQILRRIDVNTGQTEVMIGLNSAKPPSHTRVSFDLVVGRGNRAVLQYDQPSGKLVRSKGLVCFDMSDETVSWRILPPCEIRTARFRTNVQLECQSRGRDDIYGTTLSDSFDRQPLLLDLQTGTCQPDLDWRDPFSALVWHTGALPIIHAQRVNRAVIAVLDQKTTTRRPENAVANVASNRRSPPQRSYSFARRQNPNFPSIICLDAETGELNWYRIGSGTQIPLADTRYGKIVRKVAGGIEVTDVKTGKDHTLKAKHVGLELTPANQLPTRIDVETSKSQVTSANDDEFHDRLLLALPAVPIALWCLYCFFRWRSRRNSRSHIAA